MRGQVPCPRCGDEPTACALCDGAKMVAEDLAVEYSLHSAPGFFDCQRMRLVRGLSTIYTNSGFEWDGRDAWVESPER